MKNIVILVIEDSEITRLAITLSIQEIGLKTEEASDGFEGLAKATATRYAAIIMDLHMPGLTGIECTGKIREFEQLGGLSPTAIIGFTAADDFQAAKEACLAAGMNECLPKNCPMSMLRQAISELALTPAEL